MTRPLCQRVPMRRQLPLALPEDWPLFPGMGAGWGRGARRRDQPERQPTVRPEKLDDKSGLSVVCVPLPVCRRCWEEGGKGSLDSGPPFVLGGAVSCGKRRPPWVELNPITCCCRSPRWL